MPSFHNLQEMSIECCLLYLSKMYSVAFQVCEQCPNVKYEREGEFITVDIEKGMQDSQVSVFSFLLFVYALCQ